MSSVFRGFCFSAILLMMSRAVWAGQVASTVEAPVPLTPTPLFDLPELLQPHIALQPSPSPAMESSANDASWPIELGFEDSGTFAQNAVPHAATPLLNQVTEKP